MSNPSASEKHKDNDVTTAVLKAIGFGLLGAVLGLIAGLLLAVAGFIIIGIATWSSDTGIAVAALAFFLSLLAGPLTGCLLALTGPVIPQTKKQEEYRYWHGEEPWPGLVVGSFCMVVALALLIGGIVLPICNGWIGWLRTIPVFLLLLGPASWGYLGVDDWFSPDLHIGGGWGGTQPAGTKKVYDKEGYVTGYIEK